LRPKNFTAAFDFDLAIHYRPGNPTSGADQQPLTDDEITLKEAVYIGIVDRAVVSEDVTLIDYHVLEIVQLCLHRAFHDQWVAGVNLARKRRHKESPAVPSGAPKTCVNLQHVSG
jgi:hypothetical protein